MKKQNKTDYRTGFLKLQQIKSVLGWKCKQKNVQAFPVPVPNYLEIKPKKRLKF